jgi:hypothetical protein
MGRMSQLRQMQLQYQPVQDRLVLRINTGDKQEFAFWLTRRLVLALWPALVKGLATHDDVVLQHDTGGRKAVLAFKHEAAAANADFGKPYEEDPEVARPLGERPLLVAKVDVRRADPTRLVLALKPAEGRGVELALTDELLHNLCRLLSEGVQQTGWGVDLSVASGELTEDSPERPAVN